LEGQGIDGRMRSEWILGRLAGECRLDSVGPGYGPVAGCCEYGDEPSGSGSGATEWVSYFPEVQSFLKQLLLPWPSPLFVNSRILNRYQSICNLITEISTCSVAKYLSASPSTHWFPWQHAVTLLNLIFGFP
jgi:hypothetical protein